MLVASLLIACNIVVAMWVVVRRCFTTKGVEVNHVLLFTVGFLFYWILPVLVGTLRLFEDAAGMLFWYNLFDAVPQPALIRFLAASLLFYLAFIFGSVLGESVTNRSARERRGGLAFRGWLLNLYLIPGVAVSIMLAYALRGFLFRGYQDINYSEAVFRGSLVSTSLFLLALAFLYIGSLERVRDVCFRELIMHRFFLAYFLVASLILTMGGRIYFISSILMLLVYRSVYIARLRLRTLALCLLALAVASGVAGIIRMGGSITIAPLMLNIAAEPLYTSFALMSYLANHEFELFKLPVFLMSGFINLLPTILVPFKAELMVSPSDHGYVIIAPFGALNSFVSFMINFGVVGTVVALTMFGAFLGSLKARRPASLSRVIYIMVSGWLAFTFFRDGFQVSIVKVIFQYSILLPILIVLSLHVVTSAASSRRRNNPKLEVSSAAR